MEILVALALAVSTLAAGGGKGKVDKKADVARSESDKQASLFEFLQNSMVRSGCKRKVRFANGMELEMDISPYQITSKSTCQISLLEISRSRITFLDPIRNDNRWLASEITFTADLRQMNPDVEVATFSDSNPNSSVVYGAAETHNVVVSATLFRKVVRVDPPQIDSDQPTGQHLTSERRDFSMTFLDKGLAEKVRKAWSSLITSCKGEPDPF